jgi:hypothetical protein
MTIAGLIAHLTAAVRKGAASPDDDVMMPVFDVAGCPTGDLSPIRSIQCAVCNGVPVVILSHEGDC